MHDCLIINEVDPGGRCLACVWGSGGGEVTIGGKLVFRYKKQTHYKKSFL